MGYDIRLEGDTAKLMNRLKQLENIDIKGINSSLSEAMRTSTVERFKQGKGPDGRTWPTSRRAAEEGGKTLVKSARMRNSIRSKSNETGFAVGTNVVYAATHQKGVQNKIIRAKTKKGMRFKVDGHWLQAQSVKVTIPPRPFLGVSKEDEREIQDTLEDALKA